jgi:hypothetical protein
METDGFVIVLPRKRKPAEGRVESIEVVVALHPEDIGALEKHAVLNSYLCCTISVNSLRLIHNQDPSNTVSRKPGSVTVWAMQSTTINHLASCAKSRTGKTKIPAAKQLLHH